MYSLNVYKGIYIIVYITLNCTFFRLEGRIKVYKKGITLVMEG